VAILEREPLMVQQTPAPSVATTFRENFAKIEQSMRSMDEDMTILWFYYNILVIIADNNIDLSLQIVNDYITRISAHRALHGIRWTHIMMTL
jgi:hypothetical protein